MLPMVNVVPLFIIMLIIFGRCFILAARVENWEFAEYDLDNEDEDWLQQFNNEKKILAPEKYIQNS